jgi:hypothetical protein
VDVDADRTTATRDQRGAAGDERSGPARHDVGR